MVILWYFLLEYYIAKCHVFVHLPSAEPMYTKTIIMDSTVFSLSLSLSLSLSSLSLSLSLSSLSSLSLFSLSLLSLSLSLCTVIEAANVLVFPGPSLRLNDVINNQLKKPDQKIIHITNKTSGKNKNLCLTCAPNACWHVCKAYQLLMCKENLWWELAEVNRG